MDVDVDGGRSWCQGHVHATGTAILSPHPTACRRSRSCRSEKTHSNHMKSVVQQEYQAQSDLTLGERKGLGLPRSSEQDSELPRREAPGFDP